MNRNKIFYLFLKPKNFGFALSSARTFAIILLLKTSAICLQAVPSASGSGSCFVENKGQWPDQVLFMAKLPGHRAWITKSGVTFDFYKVASDRSNEWILQHSHPFSEATLHGHVVEMLFDGSSDAARPRPQKELEGKIHYFIGNDPKNWATNLNRYATVEVLDVYPGVNVFYYFEGNYLRFDFRIKSSEQISDIKIKLTGADALLADDQKRICINTSVGEVEFRDIKAWQNSKEIPVLWKKSDTHITFEVAAQNSDESVLIDPLVWSTFFGGQSNDYFRKVDVDQVGNPVVCGISLSADFPTTTGAYSQTKNLLTDVVISKFTSNGILIFSTFIGGIDIEEAYDIRIASNNNIYVAGRTRSFNYPTTSGAFSTLKKLDYDGFITCLKFSGDSILSSTFLGGDGSDQINALELDLINNVYVCGSTLSSNFPVTQGAYQLTKQPYTDGFVTKLNASLGNVLFSTYLGGNNNDYVYSIAVDGFMNVYVSGQTSSVNFPVTPGSFGTQINTFVFPTFVTKFNMNGSNILFSRVLGSYGISQIAYIGISSDSILHLAGYCTSQNSLTNTQSYNPNFIGYGDVFYLQMPLTGDTIWYSTYLGSTYTDYPLSMHVMNDNTIAISGFIMDTASNQIPSLPLTANAFQKTKGGGYIDGFFLIFHPIDNHVSYYTYCGGSLNEQAFGIRLHQKFAYVTGHTNSVDFPVTPYAFQTSIGGNMPISDGFLLKVGVCDTTFPLQTSGSITSCMGSPIFFQPDSLWSAQYIWSGPNGFYSQLRTLSIPSPDTSHQGWYFLNIVLPNGCVRRDSFYVTVTMPVEITVTDTLLCTGDSLYLAVNSTSSDSVLWTGPAGWTSHQSVISVPSVTPAHSGYYVATLIDSNQCVRQDSIYINVVQPVTLTLDDTVKVCAGDTIVIQAPYIPGFLYQWNGPGSIAGDSAVLKVPGAQMLLGGWYKLTYTDTNGCTTRDSVWVQVVDAGTVTASSNTPCIGDDLILSAAGNSSASYYWTGPGGFSSTLQNPIISSVNFSHSGIYRVYADVFGCIATDSVVVEILPLPEVHFQADTPVCKGSELSIAVNGNALSSVLWKTPTGLLLSDNPLIIPKVKENNQGWFVAEITDTNGCKNKDSIYIRILPLSSVKAASNSPVIEGGTIQLFAQGENIQSFDWSGPNNFSASGKTITIPNAQNSNEGVYIFEATLNNGCKVYDSVYVKIKPIVRLYVPNAFTPNGDGVNDFFHIESSGIVDFEIHIFNRWGEVVFQSNNPSFTWDGTHNSQPVPQGIYLWRIRTKDLFDETKIHEGHIKIIR